MLSSEHMGIARCDSKRDPSSLAVLGADDDNDDDDDDDLRLGGASKIRHP